MRNLVLLTMAVIATHAAPSPAIAEASGSSVVQDARLSDAELAEQRGGFAWNGLNIELGAEIRSYVHDELVMQTNIRWTATGAETTRYVSGSLSESSVANLRSGILAGGGITMKAGDQAVFVANDGQTAFLHRADGSFQNIVLNTASNAKLRQEMDIQLDVGNFTPLQGSVLSERIGSSLATMMNSALGTAGGL